MQRLLHQRAGSDVQQRYLYGGRLLQYDGMLQRLGPRRPVRGLTRKSDLSGPGRGSVEGAARAGPETASRGEGI